MTTSPIRQLRLEMGLTQTQFALRIGLANKASVAQIEAGDRQCSLAVALKIEELSGGRIDAATLNADVAAARSLLPSPGACASGGAARQYQRSVGAEAGGRADTAPASAAPAPLERVIICEFCEERLPDGKPLSCACPDCPHAQGCAA